MRLSLAVRRIPNQPVPKFSDGQVENRFSLATPLLYVCDFPEPYHSVTKLFDTNVCKGGRWCGHSMCVNGKLSHQISPRCDGLRGNQRVSIAVDSFGASTQSSDRHHARHAHGIRLDEI